ncbi:MAG: GTP 3',8-cyclase MoaA [Chloroflexi bacterium]|nr:GTP 3',8-cyclase MoaA [Chloroflexota bacterium]MBI3733310.1 GTP 3',8-cyclase MoaA [Chloroflexota bacterium]
MPLDSFHRDINYLRISLTDRCNLRCQYCMPLHGLTFVPDPELLTAEEIEKVVRAAAGIGFRKFRLTGGEPTLRPDLIEITRRIAGVSGAHDLGMTTNGMLLERLARPLKEAGLKRVNVHVDSLNEERVKKLMRFVDLDNVWRGIRAAEAAGLLPVKLNAVVARGYNEDDVVELARLTVANDWQMRYIELMPLGSGPEAQFSIDRYVSNVETKRKIEAALGTLTPLENADPSDEAVNYRLPGARGVIGFISPVSEPYCGTCNRMRLTADGKFHLCLLHDDELDVKKILRGGGTVADIQEVLNLAITAKPTGHGLAIGVHTQNRKMHQIGG